MPITSDIPFLSLDYVLGDLDNPDNVDFPTESPLEIKYLTQKDVKIEPTNGTTGMKLTYTPIGSFVKFDETLYKPTAVVYYHGDVSTPIHGWSRLSGETSTEMGEIVIKHDDIAETDPNKELHIHIMTKSNPNTIGFNSTKAMEIFNGRTSSGGPAFTADAILPRKPFLYYVHGDITNIVIIPNHNDNNSYIEIPENLLGGVSADPNSFVSNTIDGLTWMYSTDLPKGQMLDEEIYIDCNPVGENDILEPIKFWSHIDPDPSSHTHKGTKKGVWAKIKEFAVYTLVSILIIVFFCVSLLLLKNWISSYAEPDNNTRKTPKPFRRDQASRSLFV